MNKLLIRFGVIVFWIALIFSLLYFPKWKENAFGENTINVFAWGDILEPSIVADFERETGIHVNLNYYSSNEELIVKLKATGGRGYDLIIPSDYAVKLLRQAGLLKEIDKSQLAFWGELNPLLLNHDFDPNNHYSIPFEWEIFLIGINKEYFANRHLEPSWKLLFDPRVVTYKITMINDPIEALQFAAFYLYGPLSHLTETQLEGVKRLLIQQKQWVEAYASFRADYFLATQNCPLVVASSSYIMRTMKTFPFVGFLIPQEGSFITIENLSIPVASTREKLVYQLINYLFRPSSVIAHHHSFGFFPSILLSPSELQMPPEVASLMQVTEEQFKKFHFITEVTSEQKINDTWVEVKSASE